MKSTTYALLEGFMLQNMLDSAHDPQHIYRVLGVALDIATHEPHANADVLIAACLLHDIGRDEQFANPALCHAKVGAEKARVFLTAQGFDEAFVSHVCSCIATHRYRTDAPPVSLEAKILYDADKIDVTGALGVSRTLLYQGKVDTVLYPMTDGKPDTATSDPSFFGEYHRKLKHAPNRLFTQHARSIAAERQEAMHAFYRSLETEVLMSHKLMQQHLTRYIQQP